MERASLVSDTQSMNTLTKGRLIGFAIMLLFAVVFFDIGYMVGRAPLPAVIIPTAPLAPAPASRVVNAPRKSTETRDRLWHATLAQVARDFGIEGQLTCAVVRPVTVDAEKVMAR